MRSVLTHRGDCGLDAGRVEIVLLLVVVCRRRDDDKVRIGIRFLRVECRMEVERALAGRVLVRKSVIADATIGLLPWFSKSTFSGMMSRA